MKKLLVFHTIVAPYRVDFFNYLWKSYDMTMCIDRKEVYTSLYKDIEKKYLFNYSEFSTSKGIWSTFRYVISVIRSVKPDVVLVSECGIISIIVVLYRLLTFGKYRIVSIIDDSYNMLVDNNQFTKRHEKAEKVLIPRFDGIINVEPRVSDFFQKRYGKGIYFPIIRDEKKFRQQLIDALPISTDYIKKYQLGGKRVVLFVGRFVELKNVPRIIEAVQSLEDDSVRLVLVGAGPEEDKYRHIADTGRVFFTGPLSGLELYAWYNVADVLVLASTQEAFGAVTNEALMAGCKCVVSERAGSSCLIKDGINGYVINPLDIMELEIKLKLLLQQVDITNKKDVIKPCMMQTTFETEINKVINII